MRRVWVPSWLETWKLQTDTDADNDDMTSAWRRSVQPRRTDLARWTDAASYPAYRGPRAVVAGQRLQGFGWVSATRFGRVPRLRRMVSRSVLRSATVPARIDQP